MSKVTINLTRTSAEKLIDCVRKAKSSYQVLEDSPMRVTFTHEIRVCEDLEAELEEALERSDN